MIIPKFRRENKIKQEQKKQKNAKNAKQDEIK